MENTEYEDLDALLSSPGWERFKAYVKSEWGPEGVQFQRALVAAADVIDDPMAMAKFRQVLVAQKACMGVIDWLPARVAHLKATTLDPTSDALPMSRRGTL